ncbi:Hypothetical predicted protein [Marmota monax]|uniref:Uncharacterized protein n=1 Tax=Marmota monax TaxID=9995 RepID=A0A5E4AJD5_MARMO|nr:hypothetical protein GHT09_009978 [Marmota monax]VTJ56819.1 Hypothetical predicted protein [Marmota monax]
MERHSAAGAGILKLSKRRERTRPAAPPRAPAQTWREHRKSGPAGTTPGFRPKAPRSPFGSGASPALTRERSRSLNIRDERLAPAHISGYGHEGKDPWPRLWLSVLQRHLVLSFSLPAEGARA